MTTEPRRFLDPAADTMPALRDALEVAREELPAPEQLDSLAARIAPLLGAPPGGGGGAGGAGGGGGGAVTAASGAGSGLTAKGALGVLLVGATLAAGGGAAFLGMSGRGSSTPTPAVVSPDAPTPAAPLPDPFPAEPEPVAPVEPPPSVPEPVRPGGRAPAQTAAPEDPEAEVRLLQQAQDALSGSPTQALALAREHTRRFPRGTLAQEREVLAIDALVRLGRTAEAQTRADRFHSRWPGSSHGRRVDALIAR